jgi:superfamily II DNA or RNA helicase
MIQSLVRKEEVDDLVANYGHVIVDECHHLPAGSFERVLSEVKARYLVGLTATLQRRDGRHPITEMQLGPVRFRVDAKSQAARRPFDHKLLVRETGFQVSSDHSNLGSQEICRELANDETRNTGIIDDVISAVQEGRSPIVLTERTDHLEYLAERLRGFVRHPAKTEVRIYDYVDREVPMLMRMFEKRLATYRAIGYARGEAPLGFAEPLEERTIEYDQEALRHFQEDQ